jgi:hypothetical protein
MNLLSTLIQRITALMVVLAMVLSVSAADRTFASLAEMNADATLASGDKVTIEGDLVVEYIMESFFVLRDKDGVATCVNYDYYFKEFQAKRLEGLEEYPETPPVEPGDVFKKYVATVNYSNNRIELKPSLDMNWLEFNDFTVDYVGTPDYKPQTTKVTIAELNADPDVYNGKVISMDEAKTINVGFNSYLVQGTDTLKSFRISGLNNEDYPNSLVVKQALCSPKYGGGAKVELTTADYTVGAFTDLKAVKASKMTQDIPLNITAQIIRIEVYEGKTYLTIKTGSGARLINYSGIRVLLNTENAADKNLKIGDIISLTTQNAKLKPQESTATSFSPSLLTLDAHEITVLGNEEVKFLPIASEEVSMLSYYEFLPVSLDGFVQLSSTPTADQKAHNIAPAELVTNYGELYSILLDVTYLPKEGTKFVVAGILDVPLWMGSSNKTTIVPISEDNFMASEYEFANIAAMVEFGEPTISIIKYRLVGAMTVTGVETISAVGDEDEVQNVIFVTDETGSLLLKGTADCKVGDAITSVGGYYSDFISTTTTAEGEINFGVARSLYLDTLGVQKATAVKVEPTEVSIAQLLATDDYASKLVKVTGFIYKTVEEIVQDETITRHFIYQGTDSMSVAASFAEQEDKSYIIGNYYLNGFYTSIIPVTESISVDVENVASDNDVYVVNNTIYASGADIEVYDIMGRCVAVGVDAVLVENIGQSIFVVKTRYAEGDAFVTKVVIR